MPCIVNPVLGATQHALSRFSRRFCGGPTFFGGTFGPFPCDELWRESCVGHFALAPSLNTSSEWPLCPYVLQSPSFQACMLNW